MRGSGVYQVPHTEGGALTGSTIPHSRSPVQYDSDVFSLELAGDDWGVGWWT